MNFEENELFYIISANEPVIREYMFHEYYFTSSETGWSSYIVLPNESAYQDLEHDDDYLDYDPEPYERELRASWEKAGFLRPWKPSAEELDDACREARQIVEHYNQQFTMCKRAG
jgi:hypothetical protein